MLNSSEVLIRLALAAFFGALIGLERERKDWTAGMRTHMMVCTGSCLIMLVSAFGFADVLGKPNIVLDPSRVAAQVVSGIGFIGAGTILFLKQGAIRGLTTAAGLWTVAAIGLATGGGMYFAAGATTVIALGILWAMQPLERLYDKRFKQRTLELTTHRDADDSALIHRLLSNSEFRVRTFSRDTTEEGFLYLLRFDPLDEEALNRVMDEVKRDPVVKEVFWSR
ncbi:MAG: MgtC/SapB family protein [Bacteroidetes bacterium]|nr:MgtC/SapB family protein [Bacteroidota bacterium]MBS1942294.1 MgtC/SapB family protein [Bacteroidota bacterium]